MNSIVIVGASSGIGRKIAEIYISNGYKVGVAARRTELLEQLRAIAPDRVFVKTIDSSSDSAPELLLQLFESMGGVDVLLNCSGWGRQNPDLNLQNELDTAELNVKGFMRIVDTAFNYFRQRGGGHIAVISSIAGTRGIGSAAAYSATKRFESTYIDALAQLARNHSANITFTDIRPGFVDTDILNKQKHYPMLMQPDIVAATAVKAINRHCRVIIIDWRFAVIVFFWRLIPRFFYERLRLSN